MDFVLIFVLVSLVFLLRESATFSRETAAFIRLVLTPSIIFLYWLIEGLTGASPGKMILKLRVGDSGGNFTSVDKLFLRVVVKTAGYGVRFVFPFILKAGTFMGVTWPLETVTIAFYAEFFVGAIAFGGWFFALGPNKQALHDKIAKTAVYQFGDLRGSGPE